MQSGRKKLKKNCYVMAKDQCVRLLVPSRLPRPQAALMNSCAIVLASLFVDGLKSTYTPFYSLGRPPARAPAAPVFCILHLRLLLSCSTVGTAFASSTHSTSNPSKEPRLRSLSAIFVSRSFIGAGFPCQRGNFNEAASVITCARGTWTQGCIHRLDGRD